MEEKTIKPKKLPKLTKKQRCFVKEYIKTENGVMSALKSYDTNDYNTANQIAIENLQKPIIQNAIKSIAEQIPDEELVRVHLEGLKAVKTIFKNNNSTFKNNNSTGEIEEVGYEPDYAVRHKYLDSAYKLKGSYVPEKAETTKENVYNFFFEPKFQQNIKNYDENFKNQILNQNDQEIKTIKEDMESN